MTEAFLPLLKKADSPRIVNMASTAGLSSLIKKDDLQYKFTKKDLTVKELEGAIGEFEVRRLPFSSPRLCSRPGEDLT